MIGKSIGFKRTISKAIGGKGLLFALVLVGAGACGKMPSQVEATDQSVTTSAVAASLSCAPCVAMRSGSIKRANMLGKWTGIIDNACDRSVRVNVDVAANKDPGCKTYASKTSHNVTWWAGLGTSGFRQVYECN